MKIKLDGGFVELKKNGSNVWIAIGSEHYNSDGIRKDTVINGVEITQNQLFDLLDDIFPKENKEDVEASIETLTLSQD